MIAQASKNSPAAPSGYSEMLGSVVEKPLALVRIGWSLELATDQLTNQSSSRTGMPADKTLLELSDAPSGSFSFPIKIGETGTCCSTGWLATLTSPQRAHRATYSTFSTSTRYFTAGRVEGENARVAIKLLGDRDAIKLQDAPAPVLMPTWVPRTGCRPTQRRTRKRKTPNC